MKTRKRQLFLIFIFVQSFVVAQQIKIEPYQFISRENDTVLAELGTFKVLEDRESSSRDSIKLSFVRFKSTNPNPVSPIVYLSGGPGGSGVESAKGRRFELFMKLREVADVIAFDQRGTGLSNSLPECPYAAKFELKKGIEKAEYVKTTTENVLKCLEFWQKEKVALNAYNTTQSANDIDDLRKALGVHKISLWGISYGSHLAFEYIRLFESNIDKMVLASLEGPNETIKLPKKTEAFVFQLAKLAKENYGSEKKYPHLKEKIIKVHQKLKTEPVTTTYKNRLGGIDTIAISNFELQSAIATFYLKNPSDSKSLPKIYSKMYHGDFSEIAPDVMIMKRYIFSRVRPMSFSMDMQSGISESRKKLVEWQLKNSILGSSINFLLYEWLTSIDFPQLPNEFRELENNKVNALLFSGTLDGRTYLSDGIEIAKKFDNGRHIIVENAGHDLYMTSPLIAETILQFYKGVKLNIDKIEVEPIPFE